MIVQEKQGNEVILTLQQVEERLAGLKLAMEITNQDMVRTEFLVLSSK